MRDWFGHPGALVLLAGLPVLGVVALLSAWRCRRQLARLGQWAAFGSVGRSGRVRRWFRVLLWMAAFMALIAGIAGPRWGREPQLAVMPGRDLVVLLDVSRSMLTEDVRPSRLERAKAALSELANTVQRRGGHRLALVVFAAKPKLLCPLTHDYDFFRDKLEGIDGNLLPPDMRPGSDGAVSGTRMGAGIVESVRAHDSRFRGFQAILMVSDGDDPAADNEWLAGVQEARASGIPVYTVGLGDPEVGGRIPFRSGFLQYEGTDVWSRLQERPLEEIARRTGGQYTPARTARLGLGELFREQIEPGPVHEASEDTIAVRQQHYPWFFGAALALLASAMIVPEGKKRTEKQ